MKHENIIESLDGSHWAITREGIEQIRAFVSAMEVSDMVDIADSAQAATKNRGVLQGEDHEYEHLYDVEGSVAKLPVYGKIHPRATMMTSLSGGTSVESLRNAATEIEGRDDIDKMMLMIDSPGGNVKGLPSISSTIRSMDTETVAFAEGTMASGAYWIGSAADQVIVSPTAMVGSIGVYTMMVSKHDKMKEDGIKTQVIRSADKKALGNSAEPINEKAVKMVQEKVDALHDQFVQEVALNRNISLDQANAMADGDVEVGADSVEEGFADDVMTLDEVMSEEFELDEDSDLTETEQAYAHLSNRYEALAERQNELLSKLGELQEENQRLREEVDAQREQEIEAVLTEAIDEKQKIAPARREELRAKLENDFDGTKSMLDMIEPGAASPSDPVEPETPEQEEPATQDKAISALKDAGLKVAIDRNAASTYERFGYEEGEDFVMADDAVEAARERDLL